MLEDFNLHLPSSSEVIDHLQIFFQYIAPLILTLLMVSLKYLNSFPAAASTVSSSSFLLVSAYVYLGVPS